MSNVVSLTPRILGRHQIECSDEFDYQFNNLPIPKNHKRRIINSLKKTTPAKFMRLREAEGYSESDVLYTLFGTRFGKHMVIYRVLKKAGKFKYLLVKLYEIITKHLRTIATHLCNTAEGGEIIYYRNFIIYDCEPTRLCVDPIGT